MALLYQLLLISFQNNYEEAECDKLKLKAIVSINKRCVKNSNNPIYREKKLAGREIEHTLTLSLVIPFF